MSRPHRPRPRVTTLAEGAKLKVRVQQYEKLRDEHPDWRTREFEGYLGVNHQEVRRLSMYADAPPDMKTALYAGNITAAHVELLLDDKSAKHPFMQDVDRINVMNKIIDGLCPRGVEPLREVLLAVAEKVRGELRDKWLDQDLRMSWDDLELAIYDGSAAAARADRESRARDAERQKLTYKFDQFLRSDKVLGWIPEMMTQLDLLDRQIDEVLASERYRKRGGSIPVKMMELATRTDEVAAHMMRRWQELEDSRASTSDPRAELAASPTTVETDEDGTESVSGTIL